MSELSVGEKLKAARTAKKLTISDIARTTKIQAWVLDSLEGNQLHSKMSPIYAKGFLASYAKELGLDSSSLIKELFPPEPEFSEKSTEAKISPAKNMIPTIPIQMPELSLAPLVGIVKKLVPALGCVLLLALLIKLIPSGSIKSKVPTQEASLSIQAKSQASTPAQELAALQPAQSLELVVKARSSCWVSIRADGKLITQQRLNAGAKETWKAKRRFELTLGNPSGVDVMLNGKSITPLVMANEGRLLITHSKIRSLDETDSSSAAQASSR
jgi:hypothetical protein